MADCYVVNAATLGVSRYPSFALMDLAVTADQKAVGITSLGLFELTGSDDDGTDIDCYIETGALQLGNIGWESHIHRVYMTLATSGTVEVSLTSRWWDDNSEPLGPFEVAGSSTTSYNRVLRGVVGEPAQYWTLKLANKDGGEFDLKTLSILADQTRRVMR